MISLIQVFAETFTNGYRSESLFFISLVSIFFGISTIIAKNPILSVLFLIGLFFSVSIYLMLLGLYFIGLSYLLVYVGAVSILFLFILMLINVRISELLTEGKNSIPLAIIAVLSFNFTVNTVVPYYIYIFDAISNYLLYIYRFLYHKLFLGLNIDMLNLMSRSTNFDLANVKSKSWDGFLIENSHITSIGNLLYSNLFILLIVTSLILLLAMVGTIVITVRRNSSAIKSTIDDIS